MPVTRYVVVGKALKALVSVTALEKVCYAPAARGQHVVHAHRERKRE